MALLSRPSLSPLALIAERVVPYFTQNPQSYLVLPTMKDAYKTFAIEITFRPDTPDGTKRCQPSERGRCAGSSHKPEGPDSVTCLSLSALFGRLSLNTLSSLLLPSLPPPPFSLLSLLSPSFPSGGLFGPSPPLQLSCFTQVSCLHRAGRGFLSSQASVNPFSSRAL